MPGQLLPIRLLNISVPVAGFSNMKHGVGLHSSRGISVFRRVFPFKLKYLGFPGQLGLPVLRNEEFGVQRFSTRTIRSRDGTRNAIVGRRSEFSRGRSVERGEFQGGQAKSLVEDEAELSDWVSDLKVGSLTSGFNTNDSDIEIDDTRVRDKYRSSGRDSVSSMKNQRGGRDGFSSLKRHRDSGPDDFGVSNKRSPRHVADSFTRNSRGSISASVSRPRQGSSKDSNVSSGTNSQRIAKSFPRNSTRRGASESEEDKGEETFRRRRDTGSRGLLSPQMRRGGRDSGVRYGQGRGGSVNFREKHKGSGRQSILMSEDENDSNEETEEEKNNSMSGFGDLLSSEDDGEESDGEAEFESASSLSGTMKKSDAQIAPRISIAEHESYLSETRFDQCSITPFLLKGIKDAGYERMTVVQEATLPVILKGKDVLAKARTGTGKTVAFMLPSIEVIVKSASVDRDQKRPPINVLVMCPTRELASQAATEARALLKYNPSIGVQVVIGGTRLALEQKRMQANPCQILVATPGRLKDHIENTTGFATRLMGVKVLVLDEADRLLDMGFRKDIERIITAVPKQRQTLLFSATVPAEVRQICHIALKKDHEFINTVEEGSEETHSKVSQMLLVAPLDKHFPLLYALLKEHTSEDADYKVLVFCTTAMVTRCVAGLLSELNLNVREIHSRKSQSYRTKVSDEFRKSKGIILVTSDVSARGVDYPDVTLVIQVGVPSDRQQYIHRLGRTGRKGKEGQGILLLTPWEEFFLSDVKDLPITKASAPSVDPDTRKKVERALSHVDMKSKESAYQAWLGYYNSNKNVGRDKGRLVELANEFSRSMGLSDPPAIPKLVLGKMGLRNVPGLRSK